MTYSIETQYYEHDGGTKFYEIVLIEEKDGPALLLKRFGKLSEKVAGGQVQSTRGSVGVCRNDRQKVAEAKLKGKPGQGKYERASAPHYGLHKFGGTAVDAATLHKLIEEHYAVKNVGSIYNYFGISHDGAIDDVSDTTPLSFSAGGNNYASIEGNRRKYRHITTRRLSHVGTAGRQNRTRPDFRFRFP